MKNAHENRKNLAKDGDLSGMDFDNDAITDVFGPDKGKGYFRAFSSHLTKSHAATSTLAMTVNASKAISSEGSKEDSRLVDKINKLSKVSFIVYSQISISSCLIYFATLVNDGPLVMHRIFMSMC